MSVLNVCPTDLDTERRHYRSHFSVPDHRISSFYRRFSWNYQPSYNSSTGSYYDTFSSSSVSSKNSSLEVIFSRLLDVLIFTSAIAITAYSYLTGTLDTPSPFVVEGPPIKPSSLGGYSNNKQYKRHNSKKNIMILHDPIEESKRQRTQEWAEQQLHPQEHHHRHHHHHHQKKRHSVPVALDNNRKVQSSSNNLKREKKRTQSLPNNKPTEKEDDEMFSRMEERLQSLIQQGQAALTSQIDFGDTDSQSMVSNRKCCI